MGPLLLILYPVIVNKTTTFTPCVCNDRNSMRLSTFGCRLWLRIEKLWLKTLAVLKLLLKSKG